MNRQYYSSEMLHHIFTQASQVPPTSWHCLNFVFVTYCPLIGNYKMFILPLFPAQWANFMQDVPCRHTPFRQEGFYLHFPPPWLMEYFQEAVFSPHTRLSLRLPGYFLHIAYTHTCNTTCCLTQRGTAHVWAQIHIRVAYNLLWLSGLNEIWWLQPTMACKDNTITV